MLSCCQDIRFQISLMKSITLLLKSLVGNYVTFGNQMFFKNSQSKPIKSVDAQHFLTDVVTTSVYIPEITNKMELTKCNVNFNCLMLNFSLLIVCFLFSS